MVQPPALCDAGVNRRSVLGWLLVAFFALRGIAIAHDEFADTRTRLAAIALLQQRGVPRERITSKWVIDGWEQVEREITPGDGQALQRFPCTAWWRPPYLRTIVVRSQLLTDVPAR